VKCRAAILRGTGMAWEIQEITLDPPRGGEVLVKMAVAGICHSDDHFATGDMVPTPDLRRSWSPPVRRMYRNGHLKLDELITRRYRLDQINDAITDSAKAATSGASSNSTRALCNPADLGCPPTDPRLDPIRARSRRSTGR
jgi:Zn-dependent alcohol dehydrogenase